MTFRNTTQLDGARLLGMFLEATRSGARSRLPTEGLDIRIRYSRKSDFSGTCFYKTNRLHVNLGRHLTYPYRMQTYVARTVSAAHGWFKPLYSIELMNGYQVVLFVLLHEYYHWLIGRAGRNRRQKESMCDRFAAHCLVERHGAIIRDPSGAPVARTAWHFQDLLAFVAPANTANARVGR